MVSSQNPPTESYVVFDVTFGGDGRSLSDREGNPPLRSLYSRLSPTGELSYGGVRRKVTFTQCFLSRYSPLATRRSFSHSHAGDEVGHDDAEDNHTENQH